jgi:8-oxo-dGTP diphosphatase
MADHEHPPFAVTADVVAMTLVAGKLSVLLVRRAADPFAGSWALPGGFLAPDEDADAAAARELGEETGLVLEPSADGRTAGTGHLEQLRTYSDPGRDPRMRVVSVAYVAVLPEPAVAEAGSDAADVRWFAVDDLDFPLAFDHARIVGDAVERIRSKLEYTTLAAAFCAPAFTIPELRRVYEAVWGAPIDGPNFSRKVTSTKGFVVETDEHRPASTAGGRPPRLFRRGSASVLFPPLLRAGSPPAPT